MAAAKGARIIATQFARKADEVTEARLAKKYLSRVEFYNGLHDDLMRQGAVPTGIHIGGVSKADMDIPKANSDTPEQPFELSLMDDETQRYRTNNEDC